MGIGFITVLQLFSASVRSIDYSDQYLKAMALANQKMGELEMIDFDTEEYSGYFEGEENYSWRLDLEPYYSQWDVEKENIRLLKVGLHVFWNDLSRERNVQLVTLKTIGKNIPATDATLDPALAGGVTKDDQGNQPAAGSSNAPVQQAASVSPSSSSSSSSASSVSGATTTSASSTSSSTSSSSSSSDANISGSSGGAFVSGASTSSAHVLGS